MTSSTPLRRWIVPIAVSAYLALVLLGKVVPSLFESELFFFYTLSAAALLLVVVVLGAWAGVFAVVAWARARAVQPRHAAWLRTAAAALVTAAIVLGIARTITAPLPGHADELAFDTAVWRNDSATRYVKGEPTPRQMMLGAVVRDVLPGRDRAQIEALLGPSEAGRFSGTDAALVYELGPQRTPLGIDSEWLLIWLDAEGRYARHAIGAD